jgi:hypothetical protein
MYGRFQVGMVEGELWALPMTRAKGSKYRSPIAEAMHESAGSAYHIVRSVGDVRARPLMRSTF